MEKIVFVCLGNICRSPMAEFVMKDLIARRGRSADFEIASRATGSWEHGNPIHPGTREIFAKHSVKFDRNKVSQKISAEDFVKFDRIIAMDENNLRDLTEMAPAGTASKIQLLLDAAVPDPYFTGDFDETYEMVLRGCQKLISENLAENRTF